MNKGLLVAFPGTGFTTKEVLFQQCIAAYRDRGYRVLELDFSMIPFKQIETVQEALEQANRQVLLQTDAVCFADYEGIVFISKSLGTVCAGWLERERAVRPRQIYLTPISETLPYIDRRSQVVAMVLGTKDRLMDAAELKVFGTSMGIPCLIMEGVGHDLKADDAAVTAAINRKIMSLCCANA